MASVSSEQTVRQNNSEYQRAYVGIKEGMITTSEDGEGCEGF